MTQTESLEPEVEIETPPADDAEDLAPEPEADESAAEGRRNERSSIVFPYGDLPDAEEIAKAVHEWGGNNVSMDSVAAALKSTVKSSGFRTKVATARVFGLIDGRGDVSLTDLGHALVDPQRAADARARAFLQVPLFREIYEAYRGKLVPGPKGLESEITRLGVASKQASRARQALVRSAQHAGFYGQGADRLVAPKGGSADGDDTNRLNDENKERKPRVDDQRDLPPEVAVLMKRLLLDGDDWPEEDLKAYISGARALYKALARQG